MQSRTKITVGAIVVVLLALLVYRSAWRAEDSRSRGSSGDPSTPREGVGRTHGSASATAAPSEVVAARDADAPPGPRRLLSATWGGARGQLGRDRPHEGNPEGPMSLVLAGGDLLVLDQVNGRLVRYDAEGRLVRTSDVPATAQDLAIGSDGTVALVDRLVGKTVTLVDPNGRKIGELPLTHLPEPGLVTAVMVDGKDVYVEKEHGALVLLGTTDGRPAGESTELAGRPSKDGTLLLTAGLTSKAQGQAYLNAMDRRTTTLRFARQILFPRPSHAVVLLDSDAKGTIYLGVAAGEPADAHVACLDPTDGHLIGRVALPLSHTPEEAFRDITVGDDGTIAFAVRTDEGVDYRTTRCP